MRYMYSVDQSPATGSSASRPEDQDLGGLLSILKTHLSSIAAVTLATLALALLYLALASPVYTASTTLLIDPRARKIVSDEVVQGGLATDAALVESQVPIITSDSVLGRVVDGLRLDQDPEFALPPAAPGLLENLKRALRGPRPVSDARTQALEQLSRGIKVKRAQKTYVVDIEVEASTPVKAARIANATAEAYLADQIDAKSEEARRANALIDARLGELRQQVKDAEIRIDDFKQANRIVTSEGGVVTEQQLGKLNAELASARAVAAEAKARYDQAASTRGKVSPESLPEAVKSGLIQKLRDQYAQVARREAALSTQLQARHPVLIEVRSQLGEIRAQIDAELKRIAEAAKSEADIAAARERELVRTIEKTKDEVGRSNTAQIELREMEREAAATRELLTAFLARAKETQEQQNISTAEARVVTPAAVPSRPSRPSPLLLLSLGLLGGLGLGIAQALARDLTDRSVKSEADVSRVGSLKLLATLPFVPPASLGSRLRRHLTGSRSPADIKGFGDLLAAIADTSGRQSPEFRQGVLRLLSRVKTGVPTGQCLALMIAAPRGGSGGSTTALSLAYAAALAGDRVLLVDANSNDEELSGVFAADLSPAAVHLDSVDSLKRVMSRDQRSGLAFLPIALADLKTLTGDQRRRLVSALNTLAQSFDMVVYDGGGMLDDESAASLLPAVDRIVLAARRGRTTRDQLSHLAELLEPARDRIAGAVLTEASAA